MILSSLGLEDVESLPMSLMSPVVGVNLLVNVYSPEASVPTVLREISSSDYHSFALFYLESSGWKS